MEIQPTWSDDLPAGCRKEEGEVGGGVWGAEASASGSFILVSARIQSPAV